MMKCSGKEGFKVVPLLKSTYGFDRKTGKGWLISREVVVVSVSGEEMVSDPVLAFAGFDSYKELEQDFKRWLGRGRGGQRGGKFVLSRGFSWCFL